ncbi:MAG: DUF2007 domain-containing protein [Rhodospirillales bacterium]|nr:DUF2007 domain-containing protein [Rhodospirillales bacterium]
MIELTRSEDAVFVSWLEARLSELGIRAHILDGFTCGAYGGALSAVQRRIMVDDADAARARQVLDAARGVADDV